MDATREIASELDFISSIDARFPYSDLARARDLVDTGCRISPNAAFTVALELARPQRTKEVDAAVRSELFSRLRERLVHPLSEVVLAIAERAATGERLSEPEVITALRTVGSYAGQWQALNIVYFSAAECTERLDATVDEIEESWKARLASRD